MKKILNISAAFDQPGLLEDMVEKLACRRYDIGYSKELLPFGHKALDTSSTETYVSGTVSLMNNNETINMPFISSFLFTCTKTNIDPYKLAWSSSLS